MRVRVSLAAPKSSKNNKKLLKKSYFFYFTVPRLLPHRGNFFSQLIYNFYRFMKNISIKSLNKIPPKQKTSYTSKILRKFGLFVLKNYKFKGYNSIILFKVKKGKYKSYILKKTTKIIIKYGWKKFYKKYLTRGKN